MNKAKDRNTIIRKEIEELISNGYSRKQAIWIVAEKHYLSFDTVRDIVYDKRRK